MQIVIDIPDKVYGVLKYFEEAMGLSGKKEDENDDVKTALIRAIVNGTPLDKIRAEVMNLTDGDTPERIWNVDVLQIIDKYKGEGSDKE